MYYKPCKESNKVNLCWVFSDGQKGHEIQSNTLAHSIAKHVNLYQFNIRQPWLSFAPRLLPKFDLAINWITHKPDTIKPPDIIITTGRKAAAVGKHYRLMFKKLNHSIKHVQILNPKDNLENYDVVLIPEHDLVQGDNVINFVGSIHPYNDDWFTHTYAEYSKYIAIILGNPKLTYFKSDFADELAKIRSSFAETPLFFCGSPRLIKQNKSAISSVVREHDKVWFNEQDGVNPYQPLLRSAKKICVSSDSINMINEACQSPTPVSILAINYTPTPKHQRFINSIIHRICSLESASHGIPIEYPVNKVARACLQLIK